MAWCWHQRAIMRSPWRGTVILHSKHYLARVSIVYLCAYVCMSKRMFMVFIRQGTRHPNHVRHANNGALHESGQMSQIRGECDLAR